MKKCSEDARAMGERDGLQDGEQSNRWVLTWDGRLEVYCATKRIPYASIDYIRCSSKSANRPSTMQRMVGKIRIPLCI